MQPIYLPENTSPAYQLNWSLSLFGKDALPEPMNWRASLAAAVESDGVRILETHQRSDNVLQFLISSLPELAPAAIVRSAKGRLQYLIREQQPKAFRRNYHISSVGEARSDLLENYIRRQPQRHLMADPQVQNRFEQLQFHDPAIDLGRLRIGHHGQFLHSLQVVIENSLGWSEVREEQLDRVRRKLMAAARKKSWQLARIGLLSNHLHILVGVNVTESPQSVALSIMNNIAFVYDMTPILKYSYYVGTFGSYDRGAIRNTVDR